MVYAVTGRATVSFFVCLLNPAGAGLPDSALRAYEALPRSRQLPFQWQSIEAVSVLLAGERADATPLVVRDGVHLAIGMARLDNRAELEQWSPADGRRLTDLELMLRVVAHHGPTYVPRFLGDFAFVAWNLVTRTGLAACDAFAVKRLYYAEMGGLVAFASRGEALALQDWYDVQYLAELVAACTPSPGLSVYAEVKSLPAGTLATLEHGKVTVRRYWSAFDFALEAPWRISGDDAGVACRQLLAESVRSRLGNNDDTWAQLSGGMDSSSVVSVAQWLAASGTIARGLTGTISYVDTQGTGADERAYSGAVANHWGLRNVTIVDTPIWYDHEQELPWLDEPSASSIFYPRDRRLCEVVRGAGGRVLLTGVGGDNLFTGNMFFFADWLVRGKILAALREMASRAAKGRVSFWELAYRNGILPLLPKTIQRRLVRDEGQTPPWISHTIAGRYGLHARESVLMRYAGSLGRKYGGAVATGVAEIGGAVSYEVIQEVLDVRHPYLYRPLVEFALRLPPELCARPNARKWALREAMRGLVPEVVRTRVGKAGPYGRFAWSLSAQRELLSPLLDAPILADLGVVDPTKLRAWFETAPHMPDGRQKWHATLHHTLAIEAWLQMRSGRWPSGGHQSAAVSANQAHSPSS
jgi:asparagine synthase (glutamine-hydrolysing)